jgi:hypothetical protein
MSLLIDVDSKYYMIGNLQNRTIELTAFLHYEVDLIKKKKKAHTTKE